MAEPIDWTDIVYFVNNLQLDHHSTLHANPGTPVQLAVREYRPREFKNQPVVVMLHGASVPGFPAFDFGRGTIWSRYSWARALADQDIHVFIVEQQGSGKSTHPQPMDDTKNFTVADQEKVYVSGPFWSPYTGEHPYGRYLNDTDSDVAELGTVLNWIAEYRGIYHIHLIGYSAGAFTVGRFTLTYPYRVNSLFLLAPIFPPYGLTGPIPYPDPRLDPAKFGVPMTIQTCGETAGLWKLDLDKGARRESDIEDALWKEIMKQDPLAASWGWPGIPGVIRIRTVLRFGWNLATVTNDDALGVDVPVAIVYGESDSQVFTSPESRPLPQWGGPPLNELPGPPFDPTWLYRAIKGRNKVMFQLPRTGHFMPWENSAATLHDYSAQWIKTRSIEQHGNGAFSFIRTAGGHEMMIRLDL
ncbi:alpha/beta hydrolase [Micromonospora sp. NPDC023966]|uniref:alpha/beta hydrolase n=1 Tax=Micromonospora sp. NPDC023966 TaxID=3154699 RepID=UPI0033C12E36